MEIQFKTNTNTLSHEEVSEFLKNHNLHELFTSYEFANLVNAIHSWTDGDKQKIQEFVNFLS